MLAEGLGLFLVSLHFSVPLAYYAYLKRHYHKPWATKVDTLYRPQITVIVPTYNESQWIEGRLDNLIAQNYPVTKLAILVVDSGSTDATAAIVQEWLKKRSGINLKLIREPTRGGKLRALKIALGEVQSTSEVVVFTDADAYWETGALSEVASFLADASVGAVTGSISYVGDSGILSEDVYRNFFNFVRVAESKLYSTAVVNGPMIAIKSEILRRTGLPDFPGSDDSAFACLIAFAGHRVLAVEGAVIKEFVRGNRLHRRVRRAQCLLLNFHHTKRYAKKMNLYVRSKFDSIWRIEWWLCVANPWLLLASVPILGVGAILNESKISWALLAAGTLLLLLRPYRTWVLEQVYLVLGAIRNLWTSDAVWNR